MTIVAATLRKAIEARDCDALNAALVEVGSGASHSRANVSLTRGLAAAVARAAHAEEFLVDLEGAVRGW